ncbi:peroxiredoxin [Desulforhopalus vacuolatus]|uniref:peroxiredoxin n=1 Tax=Desulforhopalus vacuolatus TaxID=40414 RepID=UPI001964F950|nr:peroxiredoxin [Desulforhopalus vacuolatus]MBM9520504.1 peroxiredoxin [Desulforhopalus vacuolatus]
MSLLVTNPAPDFTATAVMPDNSFKEDFTLSDYKGRYIMLFFYPMDFTFVCPSEIIAFNKAFETFKAANCEVISVSIDSHFTHLAWKNTPVNSGGIGDIRFPMVSDLDKSISQKYGVLLNNSIALRGLFIIDRKGIIRHSTINDLPLGRDVNETLRVLDALQFTEKYGDVCPANWHKGDEAMKPNAEGVAEYLSKHAE